MYFVILFLLSCSIFSICNGHLSKHPSLSKLSLFEEPKIKFTAVPPSHVVMERDSIMLNCSVVTTTSAQISWMKNGKRIQPFINNKSSDSTAMIISSSLVLSCAESGVYSCFASSEFERIESKFIVTNSIPQSEECTAEIKTRIIEHSDFILQRIGNNAYLHCLSNLEGSWEWQFNGERIENDEKFAFKDGKLRIGNISSEDKGEYVCKVSNEFGQDFKTITLLPVS